MPNFKKTVEMGERVEKRIREDEEDEVRHRHLPDDVIIEHILPCLPVKPLTQFKVVSKQWYSSISSPNFILKHTKQPLFSHSYSPVETLFVNYGESYYLYSLENDDNVANHTETNNLVKLNPNFEIDAGDEVFLIGSSNGLIGLVGRKFGFGKYVILWNPTSNEWHNYYPEDLDDFCYSSGVRTYVRWGMGYVSSLDDFKVVRIIHYERGHNMSDIVHVFSLRSNTWRKIEFGFSGCFLFGRPKLINETLYWNMVYRPRGERRFVGFDLALETFQVFPHLGMDSGIGDILCEVGGCVSNRRRKSNSEDELVIDIVKHPGRVNSICFPSELTRKNVGEVIGYTKTGKFVVAYYNPSSLRLVDVDLNSMKSLVTFQDQKKIRIERYVPRAESGLRSVA